MQRVPERRLLPAGGGRDSTRNTRRLAKRTISDIWNAGSDGERELLRDLVLEEYFSEVSGLEILDQSR